MKYSMLFFIIGLMMSLSFSSYAKDSNRKIANVTLKVSSVCEKKLKSDGRLQATVRTIKLNIQENQMDQSKGYTQETGQVLVNMMCKPFEPTANAKSFDLCKDIEENVTKFQENPSEGYSLATARLLDGMAGKKCLIH